MLPRSTVKAVVESGYRKGRCQGRYHSLDGPDSASSLEHSGILSR